MASVAEVADEANVNTTEADTTALTAGCDVFSPDYATDGIATILPVEDEGLNAAGSDTAYAQVVLGGSITRRCITDKVLLLDSAALLRGRIGRFSV